MVVGVGDKLEGEGDYLVAVAVDDSPAFVAHGGGVAVDVGQGALEAVGGEEEVSEGVDVVAEEEVGVDEGGDGGAAVGEGCGGVELQGDDEVAAKVGEAPEVAFHDGDAPLGGKGDIVVGAGNDEASGGVDEARQQGRLGEGGIVVGSGVELPYETVAVGELAHIGEDGGSDDGAVVALEAVEVALAGGLDAFGIEDVASAGGVDGIVGGLGGEGGERRKERVEQEEHRGEPCFFHRAFV